ncbi:hypothetical protein RSAG8_05311, partial [Rhizoctonia solani AG-8 WAC10335]
MNTDDDHRSRKKWHEECCRIERLLQARVKAR